MPGQLPSEPSLLERPAVVLFDMGGVLIQLASLEDTFGLRGDAAADFWPRWLASSVVRDFESGVTGPEAFAQGIVADLDLDLTPIEALERFRLFPRGLFPGAVDLVRSLPAEVETGVLSNTNALHWEAQIDHEVLQGLCDHEFLSYRMGVLKPDRACFERVLNELDRPSNQVLFLDDNAINVDGARAMGMRAEVAEGPDEAAMALVRHGFAVQPTDVLRAPTD